MTTTDYRLPRDITPSHYEVVLEATPRRKTFSGSVSVTLQTGAETNRVVLHARDLSVSNARAAIRRGARTRRVPAKVRRDPEREVIELTFERPLPRGRHEVAMQFKGKLNPNMHGLYLGKDGREAAICSQCEATDARAIFPCFDEPNFKATIGLTVRTDPNLTVIANGVPLGISRGRGGTRIETHRFEKTRIIPTYLFAVTIGDYEATEVQRVCRVPTRVVCGPGKLDQTAFAHEVTARVLPWYEEYFGHRYNYQKLDQVAVPGFDAGAMENVGAIFYRRSLLLLDPAASSWAARKRIAEVIAHEIAHQWFGNLVTMKWWDDLWLNEAFATWIAYKAVDAWRPDWRMWDDYLEHKEGALAADSLHNTHPIYTPVASPAEATELFDIITYEKGCAVLRMAESFLGEQSFRRGIQSYIRTHENGNAEGRDLWDALASASGQPVDILMQSWIRQPGFPLVSARTERRGSKTVLHLTQRRFFADAGAMTVGPGSVNESDEQLWKIPMVIRYGTSKRTGTRRFVLESREDSVTLPADVRWVHPNHDATGFYRVELSHTDTDALLAKGLRKLSAASRASLLEDTWALVRVGRVPIQRFMDVLAAYRDEDDHIVVRAVTARLGWLDERLVGDADRSELAAFARWLLKPALDDLGWHAIDGEGPAQAVRRAAVIGALGRVARDPAVLRDARAHSERERNSPADIEPNLAGTVIALAALDGDQALLEAYVEEFARRRHRGDSPELQARYLGALSSFEKPALVRRVLELCLDGTVPQEQLRLVVGGLLARRSTQLRAWKFLKEHWQTVAPRVGAMGIARLVETTGSLPPARKKDVQRFFASHPVDEARRALQKALEAMELRRALAAREAENLGGWLQQHRQHRALASSAR